MVISHRAILLACMAGALASCGKAQTGESEPVQRAAPAADSAPFERLEHATFAEPWAMAWEPGRDRLFVTERAGSLKFYQPASRTIGTVTGVPQVDYGGQGGLGDIAFSPDYANDGWVYLSWAEAGTDNQRGAAVGRGKILCSDHADCRLDGFETLWRQSPKVSGRGHYSHRIAFSPDGEHLYIASGDRQKMAPAQDNRNTLGTIVRLRVDGQAAGGNPYAGVGAPQNQIWSSGHRNILGLAFDGEGRLWDAEHGPAGGDELNLVKKGANYGWPVVSEGQHYDGGAIAHPRTRPDLSAAQLSWTPVIAPGDLHFYRGRAFAAWRGQALIAGLKSRAIIRVTASAEGAKEVTRYAFEKRIRALEEAPNGDLWVAEDGKNARLFQLRPTS